MDLHQQIHASWVTYHLPTIITTPSLGLFALLLGPRILQGPLLGPIILRRGDNLNSVSYTVPNRDKTQCTHQEIHDRKNPKDRHDLGEH